MCDLQNQAAANKDPPFTVYENDNTVIALFWVGI